MKLKRIDNYMIKQRRIITIGSKKLKLKEIEQLEMGKTLELEEGNWN